MVDKIGLLFLWLNHFGICTIVPLASNGDGAGVEDGAGLVALL